MVPSRKAICRHTHHDHCRAEPDGKALMAGLDGRFQQREPLEKESKSRHDKTEPHKGDSGTNPGKERALGSEVVAYIGRLGLFRR